MKAIKMRFMKKIKIISIELNHHHHYYFTMGIVVIRISFKPASLDKILIFLITTTNGQLLIKRKFL